MSRSACGGRSRRTSLAAFAGVYASTIATSVIVVLAGCVAPGAPPPHGAAVVPAAPLPAAGQRDCFRDGAEGPLWPAGTDVIDLRNDQTDPSVTAVAALSRRQILDVVQRQSAATQTCHHRPGGPSGSVVVQLEVNATGSVVRSGILSSTLPKTRRRSALAASRADGSCRGLVAAWRG